MSQEGAMGVTWDLGKCGVNYWEGGVHNHPEESRAGTLPGL